MYPQQPYQAPPDPSAYDFIVNPTTPPRRPLFNNSSLPMRVAIVGGGLLVLLIMFVLVKNLLTAGSGNAAALVATVNQQQEIVTLTTAGTRGPTRVSGATASANITTNLTVSSAETQLLSYMKKHGQKVAKNQLIYPGAKAITAQLTAAQAAGTYDTTFQQVLKLQLTAYQTDLKRAFAKTATPSGRALLQQEYNGATLLLRQFSATP